MKLTLTFAARAGVEVTAAKTASTFAKLRNIKNPSFFVHDMPDTPGPHLIDRHQHHKIFQKKFKARPQETDVRRAA
ncbi:hypothetical protein [Phreatobacter sp. AB_2022a]|uniref:hypothetical protein n=1 Tax=Phreatobacter sp. AB_2022a TaxID=3003134 RepID=UPI00228725D0|nr:hypothetical protein [Phreatobacter sp. AB_2022a]MCZ0738004.1 hypothetical protein [Phreatobacter sp. AB_2022a]